MASPPHGSAYETIDQKSRDHEREPVHPRLTPVEEQGQKPQEKEAERGRPEHDGLKVRPSRSVAQWP